MPHALIDKAGNAIKPPIINCHTHIFTGDHVPPFLAKTFIPWPFYRLLNLSWIVAIFRAYYKGIYRDPFRPRYKRKAAFIYKIKQLINRNFLIWLICFLAALWLTLQAFFICFYWIAGIIMPDGKIALWIEKAARWLDNTGLLAIPSSGWLKLLIVVVVILFVKSGRNFILFFFKKIWSFLGMLPGPKTKELLDRYILIGRFSFHREQVENFKRLRNQYPEDTKFIVLPMDMEFMEAGRLKKEFVYRKQMAELADIKQSDTFRDQFYPFVFIDPRRLKAEPDYFQYHLENGKIVLDPCFVKEYIEDRKFSGFKIYPALGYFPFEEILLPVWRYAAENNIPVLTHCIRGNIFYRGTKLKEWDYHPIFTQAMGDDNYSPLLLNETKNIKWINDFTHPLNYLCLLSEELLRKVVAKSSLDIQGLFGFKDEHTPLACNLDKLKICFGHYGGEDEWKIFFEKDRDNFSSQLIKNPGTGILFFQNTGGVLKQGKLEQVWKYADWYSIISSLMLQYPNVYADLSFILHDPDIQPLLTQTLSNPKLKEKVLFGTDFYVVRNHKSEKRMLAEMIDQLSENEFDQIARINPHIFLQNSL